MKKVLLVVAMFASGLFVAIAQSSTTLTIRLYPIQTIEINPLEETEDYNFEDFTEFTSENLSDPLSYLSIQSTGGFMLKVESNDDESKSGKGDDNSLSTMLLVPSDSYNSPLLGAEFTSAFLSAEPQTLISHDRGGINKTFSISYNTDNSKINRSEISSTDLVYSIEAK